MEVRRLLTALNIVWSDIQDLEITQLLAKLNAAAQGLAGSPSDVAASEAFTEAADALKEALQEAKSNESSGSIRLALREAGLESLTGTSLLARLNKILQAVPFLVPQAAKSIQDFEKEFKKEYTVLDRAITSLEALNFTAEALEENVYEIGVLMPSHVTKDDLRVIEKELDEWVYVIDRIQELVDGHPSTTIPVRSISSGSLDLFCSFRATGAEAMMLLSLGAYTIINFIRDAQRRRKEMENLQYPREIIDGLVKHEATLLEKGKEEIVEKLLRKASARLPENRENELRTALIHAVAFVLHRVNSGVDVEVSVPEEAEEAEEEAKLQIKELRQNIERMQLEMKKIVATLPDRTTPVLQIPDLGAPDGAEAVPE